MPLVTWTTGRSQALPTTWVQGSSAGMFCPRPERTFAGTVAGQVTLWRWLTMTNGSSHLLPDGTTFPPVTPDPPAPPGYVEPVVMECGAVPLEAEESPATPSDDD